MKKSRKFLLVLFSLVALLALAACGGGDNGGENADNGATNNEGVNETNDTGEEDAANSGSGDARTLRISLGLNDKTPLYEAAVHFKELVEEQTDELTVEVYHSAQIGDDRVATEMCSWVIWKSPFRPPLRWSTSCLSMGFLICHL